MKTIKQYIADQKKLSRLRNEAQLRAEFEVVERDGYLWLTHCGVAFKKVDNKRYAEDIALMLKEARDTAVEFEKL